MAAASTHCIRTIHSSFTTAAPHSSGAWASAAAASSSARTHAHHPSINSHNQFLYTHHLQNLSAPQLQLYADQPYAHHHHHQRSAMGMGSNPRLQKAPSSATSLSAPTSAPSPSPSGAGGRRRSASIRMPPASYIKFDPFADDPLLPSAPPPSSCSSAPASASDPTPADAPTPLTSSSQANRAAGHPRSAASSGPYTIQIPPAAPVEVQRYQQSYSRRGHAEPLYIRLSPLGGGGGGGLSSSPSSTSSSAAAKRFASKANTTVPSPPQPRSAYAAPRTSCGSGALSGPNVSKLVAGILLNRVQQVRRPMRRRMPSPGAERREYVKSCLSSVVSIEA